MPITKDQIIAEEDVIIREVAAQTILVNPWITMGIAYVASDLTSQFNSLPDPKGYNGFCKIRQYKQTKGVYNIASSNKEDQGQQSPVENISMRAYMNYGNIQYEMSDIIAMYAGGNLPQAIGASAALTYSDKFTSNMFSLLSGACASNGSMIYTPAGVDGTTAPTAENSIEQNFASMFRKTLSRMGDQASRIEFLVMNSATWDAIDEGDTTTFTRESDQLAFTSYKGRAVVVTDTISIDTDGDQPIHSVFFMGRNAVGTNTSFPINGAINIERDEKSYGGGGGETLFLRNFDIFHPVGFDFTSAPAGDALGLTNAEYANSANWSLKFDRKTVPIIQLKAYA